MANKKAKVSKLKTINLKFSGNVFTVYMELEGTEIDLYHDLSKGEWLRQIKLPVKGDLDVFMHCKAFNGTAWTLEVRDGDGKFEKKGKVKKKGFARYEKALKFPLPKN